MAFYGDYCFTSRLRAVFGIIFPLGGGWILYFCEKIIPAVKKINNWWVVFSMICVMVSCRPSVPDNARDNNERVAIYPDYSEVTLPPNIAPLDFVIKADADDYVTRIAAANGDAIVVGGQTVEIPLQEWKSLLAANKGGDIAFEIYLKRNGVWEKHPAIRNHVASDEIDSYISYRLIEPSYVGYEEMSINQRNITNFDENVIYDNFAISEGEAGQCVNCHSYQDYNRKGNMQFHLRQLKGGTVIIEGDDIKKVDLKTDHTLSGGVYPAWHPTANLIAYSVNNTGQSFHTRSREKIEVQDQESDLILYDVAKNEVHSIFNDKDDWQSFPAWSPDGKWLYYVSAHYVLTKGDEVWDMRANYDKIKYDIYRIPFELNTLSFGAVDTVFRASNYGKSATLPRISPDGRYLLFTLGDYGQFHIWHKSSDLYLMDLQTRNVRPLREVNSADVESYHSWSSNGRWILFSSRRDDGSYTRPYIAYFGKDGKAGKPFLLPQKDPGQNLRLFKSYNIPEFMVRPVAFDHHRLMQVAKVDAMPAAFFNPSNQTPKHQGGNSEEENFYE